MDIQGSRGVRVELRDMVRCVLEGMTSEAKSHAIHMNGGSLAGLGIPGLWDLFCYMGDRSAEEEAYYSTPPPVEPPEPIIVDPFRAQLEELQEIARQNEEDRRRLLQAIEESNAEHIVSPQSDKSQGASTQEEVEENEEERHVETIAEPQEEPLEMEYITTLPPFIHATPDSPVEKEDPEPFSVVPEPEIESVCTLEDFGEYEDPWSHYFSKPPAELCWWFYLSSAGSHVRAIEDPPVGFKAVKCDAWLPPDSASTFDQLLRALAMSDARSLEEKFKTISRARRHEEMALLGRQPKLVSS